MYNLPVCANCNIKYPSANDYFNYCTSVIPKNIVLFNQYWNVYVCGILNQNDLSTVRRLLLEVWYRKYEDIRASCNCLNVDIISTTVFEINNSSVR
jgi:hypothetical protein